MLPYLIGMGTMLMPILGQAQFAEVFPQQIYTSFRIYLCSRCCSVLSLLLKLSILSKSLLSFLWKCLPATLSSSADLRIKCAQQRCKVALLRKSYARQQSHTIVPV